MTLTDSQLELLRWLSQEDFSQYGECHGKSLNRLIELGLAQVHEPRLGQSAFISKGDTKMHCAVSLTDAGFAELQAQRRGTLTAGERSRD